MKNLFIYFILLQSTISKDDNCLKIYSENGENLMFNFKNCYFVESHIQSNQSNLNESKQLTQIIENFPLELYEGSAENFKIIFDLEKQVFRLSILIVNQSYLSIYNSQEFTSYSINDSILEQPQFKIKTIHEIQNISQCNQFDEIKPFNYYIYCFFDNVLNIYTIDQYNQVKLFIQKSFQDFTFDFKKQIIYIQDQLIIQVIIYDQEQCNILKIDKLKQIESILKINQNTHKFKKILGVYFYQKNFLQIYFDDDSVIFNLLTGKFEINQIIFQSNLKKQRAIYRIEISHIIKEKFQIDNQNKTIILSTEYEIPQFLIYQSKLILIYSNQIEIIEGGFIRQVIEKPIKQIYSLYSNYLIGLDKSNTIFILKFNYLQSNYRTFFVDKNRFILQQYCLSNFNSIQYQGCYDINFISSEQKLNEIKQKNRDFIEQKHFLNVKALNCVFTLNQQMIFKEFQFYIQAFNNLEFQLNNVNYLIKKHIDLQKYFYYASKTIIIQCQQNQLLIIYNGAADQVEKFHLSCDSSYGKIIKSNQNNQLFILTKNNYGIHYFSIYFTDVGGIKTEYRGLVNLLFKLTKISLIGQYLVAFHSNCTISLFNYAMQYVGNKELFIKNNFDWQCSIENLYIIEDQKQIIFYEKDKIVITNNWNQEIRKIYNKNFICLTTLIVNKNKVFFCVHQFYNIIYTYELQYDDLIQIAEFKLLNYQIKKPINFQVFQNTLIIVCTQNEHVFLLYFILQNNQMIQLSRIINVQNQNYILNDYNLVFVTEDNNLKYLPMKIYEFQFHQQYLSEYIEKNITFLVDFVENQTQIISNFTLELKLDSTILYPKLIENYQKSLKIKSRKQFIINFRDFLQGPIENIKLLNQQYGILITPHFAKLNQSNCQLRLNDFCLYNDDFHFLFAFNEIKQILFNTSLKIQACQVMIIYFNNQNNLIIIIHQNENGNLEMYQDGKNITYFKFHDQIISWFLIDQLLLIKSTNQQVIIRNNNFQFIIEILTNHEITLARIKQLEYNYYIKLTNVNLNLYQINITTIRNQDQEIISTTKFQLDTIQIQNCFQDYLAFQKFYILEANYNQTNSIFQFKLIFFSTYYSQICLLQFTQNSVIQSVQAGSIKYPLNYAFSSLFYQDQNYFILQFQNDFWLYKISDHHLTHYYPLFKFNSTILNFQTNHSDQCLFLKYNINSLSLLILKGEYEFFIEVEKNNFSLEFLASYHQQQTKFKIILLQENIESQNNNLKFNIILVFVIITLCLIMFRYLYLKNKNKIINYKTKILELELKNKEQIINSQLENTTI